MKNESLRIKAAITPSLSAGTGFSIDVKAKTSSSNPTGIDVTLDELAAGGTQLRKATSTSSLIASGGAEFASADKGPSYDDASQFDSDMLSDGRTRRGLGRGGSGDEDASPPEGAVSVTFLQAAGVEYLDVVYDEGQTTEKKDKSQIENQADWFYYSGHGQHATGCVHVYTDGWDYAFGPSQASGHWSSDLGTVIFSACSVLDIKDYNQNANDGASPGEDWIGVGPNVLLGYNWNAPLDSQGTDDIIETWHANLYSQGQVEAWRIANDIGVGHNACAIDLRFSQQKYYYFHREVVPPGIEIYTWTCKSPPW